MEKIFGQKRERFVSAYQGQLTLFEDMESGKTPPPEVENSIRPIAIGRKNYLFAGSHNGAKWAAILYTLLATAELKGLEPKSYLKELLMKIPDHHIKRLEELLPANWEPPRQDADAAQCIARCSSPKG